ncbi:hypothetical protein [Streptomyces cyaneofuscatus]|uniref:hypothetical protein n=1 Tax=Streptomyces cyaneofuscatus TaxID=66883 RepID=UPI0036604860
MDEALPSLPQRLPLGDIPSAKRGVRGVALGNFLAHATFLMRTESFSQVRARESQLGGPEVADHAPGAVHRPFEAREDIRNRIARFDEKPLPTQMIEELTAFAALLRAFVS